ncbi:Hydroxymethylglutaryl-CoA lyase, mitochondrial [Fulvia fulva]|uniref:hydroxymethylglutaryl-CoA lyase n=1 Tax=Passalora fulva TaxID=5499 RepID=A0A9Q8PAF1_PASFU|nr:Hydroxymethylglutaryl-CoA lyase, mitochondrial [Fulvia fulva]KAK4621451.1 Hydroxymethylglutaryl-CoA lyase, mitochondrial [Fulvia fulva]KAK4622400.1 Hydroxymethylglutaryl-CoA lyase, mitochondrial [Fulvia fulva]UJO18825.1 Hydroxymethylglutaryl-CoA lyase, mitochondrial [Fulvia fulva]WPV16733.1 Hydroxymethylglutaryl-CoA lyase, mitochondrial [Fulvia fulva]WPV31610.1 Hydroxymethylglutaryl-CoA lyase, mitochondrial [Fulvia fulva]
MMAFVLNNSLRRLHRVGRAFSSASVERLRILEVGPRDGLQNVKAQIPTDVKIELIQRLAVAGLRNIEATSFVPPKWIPQLADNRKVMDVVGPWAQKRDVELPVLVPNMRGLDNAIEAGASSIEVFASATEGFSKANQNTSVEQALDIAASVARKALSSGLAVRGVTSCLFADPYTGATKPEQVLYVVERMLAMGCYEIGLGDTLGVGTASQTRALLEVLLERVDPSKLAGHFHDTYGQALANVVAAYDLGIRSFDASVAGLGGCPYAKGAQGNLATEDLVYMLESSGIKTGIDLVELSKAGDWIASRVGVPNRSRAGAALMARSVDKTTKSVPTRTEEMSGRSKVVEVAESDASDTVWKAEVSTGDVLVYRCGTAAKIVLNRPQKSNSMTGNMLESLTKLFKDFSQDPSIFHIILTAKGRYFCTGMDFGPSTDRTSTEGGYYSLVKGLFTAIEECKKTTIALVDGPAFGGGVGLTFACDVRLVSRSAKWSLTEVRLGLQPAIISRFMAREWGFAFFREACLSGRGVSPDELFRIGAVHSVSDDTAALDVAADKYLSQLGRCAPGAAAKCKDLIQLAWSDAGGLQQEALIEERFGTMMKPGSEGEYGIAQLLKKEPADWAKFALSQET